MRIEPGTYIARAARLAALGSVLLAGCGGAGAQTGPPPVKGALTVYLSVPRTGVEAGAGTAVAAGARLALTDAGGRAGTREVRLVELDNARAPGRTWDPAAVEANAKRAAADPATIAYIGELDEGGSAVSVPVTNDAGILQVAPADGLTTLTREQPGGIIGTGPARYYPSGLRSFLRLVPTDALQAAGLVRWARDQGAKRVAIVQDEEIFGRALAQQVAAMAAKAGLQAMDPLEPRDDPATYPDFALRVAQQRPDAVIYTGLGGATAGPLLGAIERAVPGARLYGSSALASVSPLPSGLPDVEFLSPVQPASAYGPAAQRLLVRLRGSPSPPAGPEALYGYEAMRVVLDAIAAAGRDAGRRTAVVRAALTPRRRRSVIGDYRVLRGGEVGPARFGAYRYSAAGLRYLGERTAAP